MVKRWEGRRVSDDVALGDGEGLAAGSREESSAIGLTFGDYTRVGIYTVMD
jgi:hypothetical protein